jgi:heterodisulfide reductase subunit C
MSVTETTKTVVPNREWREKVEKLSGQTITACFQCEKCTNGCPVAFAMDMAPHRLMHSIHFGLEEPVLNSNTYWVCAACETCTTRCPNGIDIAHVMDTLKQISQSGGRKPGRKDVPTFNDSFMTSIKRHGRLDELEMITEFTLKNSGPAGLIKQAGMGLKMIAKGKLKPIPRFRRAGRQVKNLFRMSGELK